LIEYSPTDEPVRIRDLLSTTYAIVDSDWSCNMSLRMDVRNVKSMSLATTPSKLPSAVYIGTAKAMPGIVAGGSTGDTMNIELHVGLAALLASIYHSLALGS
jgi:hypothetical protein